MAKAGTVDIDLRANSAKMVSELQKGNKKLDEFGKAAGKMANLAKAAFAVFGTVQFGGMIKSSIDAGDKIQKLNQRLGVSTEFLSEMRHVTELTGVSFNTLTMALQRSTRRIAEAAQGTGEAKNALKELGLSASALNNLSPDRQFEILAQALSEVDNQADKVRLSMKLFDSEGVSLLQTMEGGAASIGKMREEARKLGLTLSKSQVDSMAAANDAMARFKAQATALGNALASGLAPIMSDVFEWMAKTTPVVMNAAAKATHFFMAGVLASVKSVSDGLAKFYDVLGKLPGRVGETYVAAAADIREFSSTVEQMRDGAFAAFDSVGQPVESFNTSVRDNVISMEDFRAKTEQSAEQIKALKKAQGEMSRQAARIYELTRTDVEKYNAELQKSQDLLRLGLIDQETHRRNVIRLKDTYLKATEEMSEFTKSAARNMQSAFADFLFDPFETGLDGLLQSFAKTMQRMAAEAAAARIFDNIKSPGGDLLGSVVSGIGGLLRLGGGGPLIPKLAEGGPVAANKPHIVGDGGEPELFFPRVSGTVVPMSKMGGAGVTINQSFDFRGTNENTAAQLRAEASRIEYSTLGAVRAEIQNGGPLARLVGNR